MLDFRARWQDQPLVTRQTVFLMFISAAWLISPALGFLLLLFPGIRRPLVQIFTQALSSDLPIIWVPVLIPVIVFAFSHPAPVDDLLKHLVSGSYHYDYHSMFWGSPRLKLGDFYIGFDHVASWVYGILPHHLAFIPFQLVLVLGFALVLPFIFRRQMPDLPPFVAVTIAVFFSVLVWLLPAFTGRMISGRPEDDLALWSAAVFLLSQKHARYQLLWLLFGFLSVPMYWLSCVYFPVVFLMPTSFRHRMAAFLSLCVSFVVFWGVYSRMHWPLWLLSLHTDIGDRVVGVAEDLSAVPLIMSLSGALLLIAALTFLLLHSRRKSAAFPFSFQQVLSKNIPISAIAIIFSWLLIPDMIRYVDVLGPFAGVMLSKYMNQIPQLRSISSEYRPHFTIASLVLSVVLVGNTFHHAPMPNVHIPHYAPGEKVLTYFSAATYDALYENPGIRVAPAMELGMTTKAIQKASFDLGKGHFDCRQYAQWHVHWLVMPKTAWSSSHPSCVHLYRLDPNGMSVWRVQ